MERKYIAIDLKSFYASVECIQRQLDPLRTHLVVADSSRTEKTICLAVSPSLKAQGIPGRPRLFEVVQKVKEINQNRLNSAIRANQAKRDAQGNFVLTGTSFDAPTLENDPSLALSYIVAPPQMRLYMDYSKRIYQIYLKYIAPDDIHIYSIDEVFIDVAPYLPFFHMSARELAMTIIREILCETGITATVGIGTNLYLAKVAMDIVAKHVPADQDGVRIAELNERTYREQLWTHEPITDFWRIGRGYAKKLAENRIFTMGDIARCSMGGPRDYHNSALLHRLFGVNAQLLIDHAWGYEPVTMADIKAYKPETSSLSSGQVLSCPYTAEKARIIVREMAERLVLDMVGKQLLTNQITLTIGYDQESLRTTVGYEGPVHTDFYGRKIPRHAHGTANLATYSSSTSLIMRRTLEIYDRIIDNRLYVRRVTLCASQLISEETVKRRPRFVQLDFFTEPDMQTQDAGNESAKHERSLQKAMLHLQKRFGKNAVLKGTSLQDGATGRQRNEQVGGHRG